jgi:hypothetical protein
MAGSCSERERAHRNRNLDVATQKAFLRFGRTRVPNFRQSACAADVAAPAKDGQSYQWIMLSAASACQRGPAAAGSSQRELGSREFLNLQALSRD